MSTATVSPLLVSVQDAADMLAISVRTLHELTKTGRLSVVRVGSRGVRYSVKQLEQFIASQLGAGDAVEALGVDMSLLAGGN